MLTEPKYTVIKILNDYQLYFRKILCDLFNSDFEIKKQAGFNIIPNDIY